MRGRIPKSSLPPHPDTTGYNTDKTNFWHKLRQRARLATGIGACGVMGLLSACNPTPSVEYEGNPAGLEVTITGDSITELMRSREIPQRVMSQHRVNVAAQSGGGYQELLPKFKEQVASGPDVAIVYLGTNPTVKEQPKSVWGPALQEMLEVAEAVPCVLLVEVVEQTDALTGTTIGTAAAINAELARAVEQHPGQFFLIDSLNDAVDASNWQAFLPDGVHPARKPRDVLAMTYTAHIDKDCLSQMAA